MVTKQGAWDSFTLPDPLPSDKVDEQDALLKTLQRENDTLVQQTTPVNAEITTEM
jgi:hypothetical protein